MIRVAQIIGKASEGGVESMIMNLYRNIDHSKVVFDFFVENTSVVIDEKEINSYGGKVVIVPQYKHLFKFKKCLKENFEKGNYDIVHSNMNALSFISLKAAKKCGIKHRICHSHSTSNKKEFLRHVLKSILKVFSKKYATDLFACSEKAGRWLYGNKVYDEGKVTIINNGIDLEKFKYNSNIRNKIRSELNLSEDTFVIGHIGRFMKQKNHDFLLDVYKQVKEKNNKVCLLLLGSGPLLEQIKTRVESESIRNVIFIAPTSRPFDYYQAMDCFVLPSLYEGLPVVGVEAQANGLTCLFSSEVTKEVDLLNSTQFISLGNIDDWVNALLNCSNHMPKRNSTGNLTTFDIKNVAINLENKYVQIINNEVKL